MPGFMNSANPVPNTAAKREVRKYQATTHMPRRPNFRSGRLAAPVTSDRKMIGMTTIFSIAMRTVPNGARTASVPSQTSGPAYRQPIPAAMPSRKAATTR